MKSILHSKTVHAHLGVNENHNRLRFALTCLISQYLGVCTVSSFAQELPQLYDPDPAPAEAPVGIQLQPDGSVVVGVDVLTAMANENVQAALKEAAEKTGNAAWYAKIVPIVWGAIKVPAVAVKEQVRTTAEYATDSPGNFLKTTLVGGAAYLVTQGDLGDTIEDVAVAVGLKSDPDDKPPSTTPPGILATRGSRVEIRDAKSAPTNVRADDRSFILIDVSTGEF